MMFIHSTVFILNHKMFFKEPVMSHVMMTFKPAVCGMGWGGVGGLGGVAKVCIVDLYVLALPCDSFKDSLIFAGIIFLRHSVKIKNKHFFIVCVLSSQSWIQVLSFLYLFMHFHGLHKRKCTSTPQTVGHISFRIPHHRWQLQGSFYDSPKRVLSSLLQF